MSLLPKTLKSFSDTSYWEDFFIKRGSKTFEWYGNFGELCNLICKYVKTADNLLTVGCGNSTLSVDMYDVGYHKNTSIDISVNVIKQMNDKYSADRPNLNFCVMDVKKMQFDDSQFSVVLDKGTLDALMPDASEESEKNAFDMLTEIQRVLRFGGRYICISLLQGHILKSILAFFVKMGWMIRIHSCIEAEKREENSKLFSYPVFIIVCTKMKPIPKINQVLEFVRSEDSNVDRMSSVEDVVESVKSIQQYALMCHQLSLKKQSDEITFNLHTNDSVHARYRVFIVDGPPNTLKYSVFIVPQGRETEWLFSTIEGRQQLRETTNSERLLVVHLSHYHTYDSLDQVKKEISERAMDFSPSDLKRNSQVPILSFGESIGIRNIVFKGCSDTTGEYIVEDVEKDSGEIFRRLIFLSNQNVIQSEAKLKAQSKKKGKKRSSEVQIDHNYLSCSHHVQMIAGIALLAPEVLAKDIQILLIGLGGGGLPSYLRNGFKNVLLDVVDIDFSMVSIAKEWFQLKADDRLMVHVSDGIDFIENCQNEGKKYEIIMFDVNNKDSSFGLSVPPPAFLETNFLKTVKNVIDPAGWFILNLVCRNEELKKTIYERIINVFGSAWSINIPEEVNEIIYASTQEAIEIPEHFPQNMIKINKILKKNNDDDLIDVSDVLKSLTICK